MVWPRRGGALEESSHGRTVLGQGVGSSQGWAEGLPDTQGHPDPTLHLDLAQLLLAPKHKVCTVQTLVPTVVVAEPTLLLLLAAAAYKVCMQQLHVAADVTISHPLRFKLLPLRVAAAHVCILYIMYAKS